MAFNFSEILTGRNKVRKSGYKPNKGLTGLDCLPKSKAVGYASILKGEASQMVNPGADSRVQAAFSTPSAYAARMGTRLW